MAYAISYAVPADEQMYQRVKAGMGDEPAKGLIAHLVVKTDAGLQHIGVWESAEDWQRFNEERLRPVVHDMLRGIGMTEMPPDPEIHELALVDIRLGS